MGEDDFRGHATEYEGHGEAEEDEVVLLHQRGVRGEQPRADGDGECDHRRPLEEDRGQWEIIPAPRANNVEYAEGDLRPEEREDDDPHPDVAEGEGGEGGGEPGGAEEIGEWLRPDGGPEVPGERHDHAGDDETLGWAVDDAEVQGVCVVGLPG